LKVSIQKEVGNSFLRGIDAATLILKKVRHVMSPWKLWSHGLIHPIVFVCISQVNVDLRNCRRDITERTYQPKVDEGMQAWSQISDERPDEPADNHLHIFVIPGIIDSARV
jgi:hypothetical protein